METTISKGKKAADKDILSLTEQLMTQLINLDGVVAEGDQKIQRAMQVGSFAIYCFQSTIISTYFDAICIYMFVSGEESAEVCGETWRAQDQERQDRDHTATVAASEAAAAAANAVGCGHAGVGDVRFVVRPDNIHHHIQLIHIHCPTKDWMGAILKERIEREREVKMFSYSHGLLFIILWCVNIFTWIRLGEYGVKISELIPKSTQDHKSFFFLYINLVLEKHVMC